MIDVVRVGAAWYVMMECPWTKDDQLIATCTSHTMAMMVAAAMRRYLDVGSAGRSAPTPATDGVGAPINLGEMANGG